MLWITWLPLGRLCEGRRRVGEESTLSLKIRRCSHLPRSQKLLHLQRPGAKTRLSPPLILLLQVCRRREVVPSDVKRLRQVMDSRKAILLPLVLIFLVRLPSQVVPVYTHLFPMKTKTDSEVVIVKSRDAMYFRLLLDPALYEAHRTMKPIFSILAVSFDFRPCCFLFC